MFYMITRDNCKWCDKAKELIVANGYDFEAYKYTDIPMGRRLMDMAGLQTVPQIWLKDTWIGGYSQLEKHFEELNRVKESS